VADDKYVAAGLPPVEEIAAQVHTAWIMAKRAQGVTSRASELGEEQMVDYYQLSDPAKELDRATVRSVYDAILAYHQRNTMVAIEHRIENEDD
jgi:hypothetical protein